MEFVVEVRNLKKDYISKKNKYSALKNVDLTIENSEFVGIMGPSGSGKSTLLNILATIDSASEGEIKIDGKDVAKLNEMETNEFRRSSLGFVFQEFNLLDTLTLKDNILLPLTFSNKKINKMEKLIYEIADKLAIKDVLDKYPYEVSGGQKQRAAAARALVTNPKLILADEPTGALDSKSAKELMECFVSLNESEAATIMMVTHDPTSASYCKRILFIKDGEIVDELRRSDLNQRDFYKNILDKLAQMELR